METGAAAAAAGALVTPVDELDDGEQPAAKNTARHEAKNKDNVFMNEKFPRGTAKSHAE